MSAARELVALLRGSPPCDATDWDGVFAAARAERLAATLAHRLADQVLPLRVAALLDDARRDAETTRTQALWEAEMAQRALAPLGISMVLLKGTAFLAAGLEAGRGRLTGDLDILVEEKRIEEAESALIAAGWERIKAQGGYDDQYYRRWMHELPPLVHRDRDRMIDVHHNILPRTSRPTPDSAALIAGACRLDSGFLVLAPADMIVHAAAHLFADGDLDGGLRNLWDIDQLLREFARDPDFWASLGRAATLHRLRAAVARALRLSARFYGTPVDPSLAGKVLPTDALFAARLLARDHWGRGRRPLLRLGFYIRSHLLRMPPAMLARHLATKAFSQAA